MAPEDLDMQSQFQMHMQSQGLTLSLELKVGPSTTHVITKESWFDPSRHNPNTGESKKYGLYVDENPPCLVALG